MTADMSPAELQAFVQALPPQVMQELSRIAVRLVTGGLAEKIEKMALDPAMQAAPGPVALQAAADTIRGINRKRYGAPA